jgi:large subunit ribosomal protein L32e
MTKEEVLNKLTSLKGIGQSKAEALVEDGYDTIDKINKASIEDLIKVKGISKSVAESIKKQLKEQKPSKTQEKPKKQKQAKEIKSTKSTKKEENQEKTTQKKESDEKEGYIVKKKPVIDKEIKRLLITRKQIKKRTPDFLREEWFRYKKLGPSKVRVGFRGPKKVRGIHPSGFEEIMIFNASDLDNINPKTQAARIGSSVGTKKRIEIEKKAKELDIRLLNL